MDAADADWLARYLQHIRVEKRLAPRTQALYATHLQGLAQRCAAEGLRWTSVRPAHARRWAAQLRGAGRQPRGIALVLSCWRGFFTWLGRQGVLSAHPLQAVRAPKAAQPLPKALDVHDALRLAAHLPQPPTATHCAQVAGAASAPVAATPDDWQALQTHCMVELLYGSGLRISEALGLDVRPSAAALGWVDAQAGEVQVLGKGGKRRTVPVGGPALQALAQWLAARQRAWPAATEAALFVGARGGRLTPQVARRQLQALAASAGLAGRVHPHMLRHSFASHVLQSSADLRAVQELLGHASITSTQIYTRLDFQHLSRAYEAAHPRARKSGHGT
ncbi:tyrosine recombinase XerC [Serpentinimonas barnesii]|uniref:tyrosine recombinase XerC n=1 Tax=Serpentinimonas barnesii TaxID=1458427 RepID=UPI0004961013|nr:tyrosine recombinase XerC [Serpentinimonas barnesii]